MSFILYIRNPIPRHSYNFIEFLRNALRSGTIRSFCIDGDVLPCFFVQFASHKELQNAVNILGVLKQKLADDLVYYATGGIRAQQNAQISKYASMVIDEYEKSIEANQIIDKFIDELIIREEGDPENEMSRICDFLVDSWLKQEKEIRDNFLCQLETHNRSHHDR